MQRIIKGPAFVATLPSLKPISKMTQVGEGIEQRPCSSLKCRQIVYISASLLEGNTNALKSPHCLMLEVTALKAAIVRFPSSKKLDNKLQLLTRKRIAGAILLQFCQILASSPSSWNEFKVNFKRNMPQ